MAKKCAFQFDPLPKGFVLSKPIAQEGYNPAVVEMIEKRGALIITRKRDGWKLFAVVYRGKVKLYTAGMREVDSRLDQIKQEIKSLKLPSGTILVGECIIDDNGNDEYTKVISLFHSNSNSVDSSKVRFMVFDLLFYGGKDLSDTPYCDLLFKIENMLEGKNLKHVVMVPVIKKPLHKAQELAIRENWEGLVMRDMFSKNQYRLDGKAAKRPKGCYKWKPIHEDDFIVERYILSPGKRDQVKEVVLEQIDPVTGDRFECGKLGSFSAKIRSDLLSMKFPIVMKVAFEARFEKSGKIRNARLLEVRTDKPVHECIAPKSYAMIAT